MATAEDDWREFREATTDLLNALGVTDPWLLVLPLLVCSGIGGIMLTLAWAL